MRTALPRASAAPARVDEITARALAALESLNPVNNDASRAGTWTSQARSSSSPAALRASARARHACSRPTAAKVVIADLQVERGEAQSPSRHSVVVFVKCDVSQEADGQAVVAAALTGLGKLMGLVNCAGIAPAVKTVGKDGAHPLAQLQPRRSAST